MLCGKIQFGTRLQRYLVSGDGNLSDQTGVLKEERGFFPPQNMFLPKLGIKFIFSVCFFYRSHRLIDGFH